MPSLDRIKGSIPPLITPFKGGEVDYETYAKIIEFQIAEGSHGILVNGTTSEPASLTIDERNRLVSLAMEVVRGRVPVIAATGSQSLAETKVLTDHAAKAGVDALLIVTPYYSRPPQRGMIQYYLEAVKGIPIPWMIYHIPGRTAVSVTVDTVKELKDKSPTFVGMKARLDRSRFRQRMLRRRRAGFPYLRRA
jgi:4-hydroxy-tetrahydrodipicolinate synthase